MSARSGPAQAQQLLQEPGLADPSRNNCCGAQKVTLFPEQADEEWGMSNDEDAKSRQAGVPRILVIEGNAGYRSVISHVVEIAGGRWDSVSEIDQGRKLLDGTKFDLVIIGVDGDTHIAPEVLKEIRALARAPLIILDESYNGALETF